MNKKLCSLPDEILFFIIEFVNSENIFYINKHFLNYKLFHYLYNIKNLNIFKNVDKIVLAEECRLNFNKLSNIKELTIFNKSIGNSLKYINNIDRLYFLKCKLDIKIDLRDKLNIKKLFFNDCNIKNDSLKNIFNNNVDELTLINYKDLSFLKYLKKSLTKLFLFTLIFDQNIIYINECKNIKILDFSRSFFHLHNLKNLKNLPKSIEYLDMSFTNCDNDILLNLPKNLKYLNILNVSFIRYYSLEDFNIIKKYLYNYTDIEIILIYKDIKNSDLNIPDSVINNDSFDKIINILNEKIKLFKIYLYKEFIFLVRDDKKDINSKLNLYFNFVI